LGKNHAEDLGRLGTESDADADFLSALGDGEREDGVDAESDEQERDGGEAGEERGLEAARGKIVVDDVGEEHGARDGLLGVYGPDLLADGLDEGHGIAGGVNGEVFGVVAEVELHIGKIHFGAGGKIESGLMNVTDDADDGEPGLCRGIFVVGALEALAEGIFAGPVVAGHGFVDEGDELGVGAVGMIKEAAGDELHTKRGRIVGADHAEVGDEALAGRGLRTTFDGDGDGATGIGEGDPGGVAGREDAGQSLDFGKDLIVEGDAAGKSVVTRIRKRSVHDEDVVGLKAAIEVIEIFEAADEQSGTGEKNDGEGDFGNDESVAEALAAGTNAATAAGLVECGSDVHTGNAKRGNDAEENAGGERNGERK